MRPILVVVGDSRIKNFEVKQEAKGQPTDYDCIFKCKRGARVEDLDCFIPQLKQQFGRDRQFFIAICGGINNFTINQSNSGKPEVVPDSNTEVQDVYDKIDVLRSLYKWAFPNSIVIIATVAPINLLAYNRSSSTSEEVLKTQGEHILEKLLDLNHKIKEGNDSFDVKTPYLASNCIHKLRGRWRIIPGAFEDGLHPTSRAEDTWLDRLHKCIDIEAFQ